jgi:pyruvate/2-oxoglutarate dehydrogenase complex dihydrolipoamide dehydrogenase (E3) component
MRTNVPHIFAVGDIVGQPMLEHKAVHEAHVAAEAAAGQKVAFNARVIPNVAYTDPEIAWVGLTEDQAKAQGIAVKKGHFPWTVSGRAIANTRDEGFTKLLFDAQSHRILGGALVGTHAGDLIGEIALAIERGADESTSARPFILIRPWARASAWRPRSLTAPAPTCHPNARAEVRSPPIDQGWAWRACCCSAEDSFSTRRAPLKRRCQ